MTLRAEVPQVYAEAIFEHEDGRPLCRWYGVSGCELHMPHDEVMRVAHHSADSPEGPLVEDLAHLLTDQLDSLNPAAMREELAATGRWTCEELRDRRANNVRLVWLASMVFSDLWGDSALA